MNSISLSDIHLWNQQGFIPGPSETEEDFKKRVLFCLNLEQELAEQVDSNLPFSQQDKGTQDILEEASAITKKLYDIAPSWILLFFSNYQLAPWHGGCAWIFQLNEQTPTAAFLQLRSQFRYQQRYLGLYQREELIAHEMVHVGRMMYQEPQFEEILAYRTSSSWRRWFGPIVRSSKESLFFISLLGVMLMADWALTTISHSYYYPLALWLKIIPLILITLALARLGWRQWQFSRCLSQLTKLYQSSTTAQSVIYRLRDREIRSFATLSPTQIQTFMLDQQASSFRWQFIMQNYPLPKDI